MFLQKTIYGLELIAVGYQVGEDEQPVEELEQDNPNQGRLF